MAAPLMVLVNKRATHDNKRLDTAPFSVGGSTMYVVPHSDVTDRVPETRISGFGSGEMAS